MGLSPAIEAFLAGQSQQSDILNKGREYQLRKEQLDQLAKQFEKTSQQAQQHLDLERQTQTLNEKKATLNMHHDILEGIQKGLIVPDQATSLDQNVAPGAQTAVPGQPDMAIPGMQRQVAPSISMPQTGSPITVDIPGMGPQSYRMPEGSEAEAVKMQSALMPGNIKQFQATTGSENTKKLENALALKDIQRDYSEKVADIRAEASRHGADTRAMSMAQAERMKLQEELFRMGLTSPEVITDHMTRIGQGYEDLSEVPAGLKGMVQTAMQKNGVVAPQGGKKFRADLSDTTAGASRMLSDFADLNKNYPAEEGMAGRALNRGLGFFNNTTELGQKFSEFGSNIASYASMTGETPGMMRSPILAKKAEAAAPSPGDTPKIREEKGFRIVDLTLSKIQRKVSSLPEIQRKEYWRDMINDIPQLKQNYKLMPVLEDILRTGRYNPDLLNKAKE